MRAIAIHPTIEQFNPQKRISKRSIADDISAGFRDEDVMIRHGLTRSQLKVVLNALQADGILSTIYSCPGCGLRSHEPIVECPRCGVVIPKLAALSTRRLGLWTRFAMGMEYLWDRIDCGGYRLVMSLKGKWNSRL